MKKYNKLNIIVSIIMFLIIVTSATSSFAAIDTDLSIKKNNEFKPMIQTFLGVLQTVGSICAVGALIAIGIKYMVGSVEEKAEYKKTLLPYFIGAIMVFATVNIVQLLYDILYHL